MTARIVMALSNNSTCSGNAEYTATPTQLERIQLLHRLQGFIFIGGVSPRRIEAADTCPSADSSTSSASQYPFSPLMAPSLHIMGEEDPYLEHSKRLTTFFSSETSRVMVHPEGHNIPSMRTG